MKSTIKWLLSVWTISGGSFPSGAQTNANVIHSQYPDQENGVSHNNIYQRLKDSRNVLWLVEENGLIRFDGQNFKWIDNQALRTALPLHILLEDADHDLWIRRDDRTIFFLNIYSEHLCTGTEKFGETFPAHVNSAVKGRNNSYLLQTTQGQIMRYKRGHLPELVYEDIGKMISPIMELSNGLIWINCCFNGNGGKLIALDDQKKIKFTIPYSSDNILIYGGGEKDEIQYMTNDSSFVVDKTGIKLGESLNEIYPSFLATNPRPSKVGQFFIGYWWLPVLLLVTLLPGGWWYRKKRTTRTSILAKHLKHPAEEMITEAVFAAQPEPWRMVQQDNEQVPEVEESIEISDTDGDVTAMNVQSQAFLTMVQHVILEHLDNSELDGKTLGKIIGMSPSQLYRKLNVLTGSSTGRYIHQIRLQEAQKLLGKKELSISDIAYMTGFVDPAYFTRLFTKAFGGSPKSFRN